MEHRVAAAYSGTSHLPLLSKFITKLVLAMGGKFWLLTPVMAAAVFIKVGGIMGNKIWTSRKKNWNAGKKIETQEKQIRTQEKIIQTPKNKIKKLEKIIIAPKILFTLLRSANIIICAIIIFSSFLILFFGVWIIFSCVRIFFSCVSIFFFLDVQILFSNLTFTLLLRTATGWRTKIWKKL